MLTGLKGSNFAGKKAAPFDTRMISVISGDATRHVDKILTKRGFKIASSSLLSYLRSENKPYRLNQGEPDMAKLWERDLAKR